MKQATFFDDEHNDDLNLKRGLPPTDLNVDACDERRLTGQNLSILKRLQQGPAKNTDLCRIALKYTSRISDLRRAGYSIQCKTLSRGVTEYRLK